MRALTAVVVLLLLSLAPASLASAAPGGKKAKQAKRIYDKVKNGRYVGTRGDGVALDGTFCADGRYTSRADNAISTGKKWRIVNVKIKKHGFTAAIKGKGGFEIAIARLRGQWKIGYTDPFDAPEQLGNMTRTKAGAACA